MDELQDNKIASSSYTKNYFTGTEGLVHFFVIKIFLDINLLFPLLTSKK